MALLQVEQLTWLVNSKSIIRDISFSIEQGETIGIVGPNGAGKSSLLKCIYQENAVSGGQVLLSQQSLQKLSRREVAQKIAVVTQGSASQISDSVFDLTVYQMVHMGLTPHKGVFDRDTDEDRQQIQLALTKVGLFDKAQQLFSTLSGGEQQRGLIARAIIQKPELLIMDEPTNHLDVYYQQQILALAKKLNVSLLITLHDLNLAAQYCDKLLLLNKGELQAFDTPKKVLTPSKLIPVFKLNCVVDQHPFADSVRVTFESKLSNLASIEGDLHE